MSNLSVAEFQQVFPDIYERSTVEVILETAKLKKLRADDWMVDIGDPIVYMPLLLKGQLRILREDEEGHELLLYYIRPGETCAMSLTCCSGNAVSNVRAVAEEDTELLLLPIQIIDEWTTKYPSFKSFILKTYQKRFEELLNTIDSIAFHNLDDRLSQLLKQKSEKEGSELKTTHQELANQLNSSREVISRLLKQMERKGKIQMGRNKITLL
ncbi:MAG: Crp/Fnr family transcriptional regulator [Flavobacteriales bacterium]|jgi:CRP/FNR family transcriptional regulator|nr:Crp/Fnr family transcriptional regulator [Flavobacteriales bacterium]MDP4717367.1 Crp/Fnr family transcriptional regulator [Flavobacteriales bacterium]MDP4731368.1 Crp/Fnr family transcriptional regulator [Flavobacteriales bacterium]MDP4818204.1 Crp/Fnr family transcriptional regulator [Flavobacteriales bacterium]MDP4951358.1 Crp/Fnr family transcriptional regulator [Flavobacteriales bacterium]